MKTLKCIEGRFEDLVKNVNDLNNQCSMHDQMCRIEIADKSEEAAAVKEELDNQIELMFDQLMELNACSYETYKLLEKCKDSIMDDLTEWIY